MRLNKKGQAAGLLLAVLMLSAVIAGLMIYNHFTGSSKNLAGDTSKKGFYDYSGKIVDYTLIGDDKYAGTAVNATFSVYDEEPTSCWDNARSTCTESSRSSYTASSGSATMQELPGTYYVIARLSGFYTEFLRVTIPSSGEVSLNDYNQAPDSKKLKFVAVDTLTNVNFTLGFTANATGKETTISNSQSTTDNKGFHLWKAVLYDNNDFNTDSDSDGTYDEGVIKVEVTIEGNKLVLFDSTTSTDLMGSDNQYSWDLSSKNIQIEDGDSLETKVYVKANVVYNTTAYTKDADELFEASEQPVKIVLVDEQGNAQTAQYVIG